MDILSTICFLIIIAGYAVVAFIFHQLYMEAKKELAEWKHCRRIGEVREDIARPIVFEAYKRLYHANGYIDKKEALISLRALMCVYGIGYCAEALEKPLKAAVEASDS